MPRPSPFRSALHRTAPHRTAPHRTAPHRTAPPQVEDRSFGGNPCALSAPLDAMNGTAGTDDPAVRGTDSWPRQSLPYHGNSTRRLFAQVTCEGSASFAANCMAECAARGSCLYGLAPPYCGWCTMFGLQPKADGGCVGVGVDVGVGVGVGVGVPCACVRACVPWRHASRQFAVRHSPCAIR
jgi:hypothetical protein